MRVIAMLAGLCLLAACGPRFEALPNPVAGEPDLRASLDLPPGPGPFPTVVLLHGCGGPAANLADWVDDLRAAGFAVAAADQVGPRGIGQSCLDPLDPALLRTRAIDTVALVRLLGARPGIRRDRIFLVGFSQGGNVVATLMGRSWREMPDAVAGPPGETPPPAAGVGVYPSCDNLDPRLETPLLLISGGADDWTPAWECEAFAAAVQPAALRPRVVVIPGAQHAFDTPRIYGPILWVMPNHHSPTGFGATCAYCEPATRQAQAEALAFLRSWP
jgi:dienelactone hydrolase